MTISKVNTIMYLFTIQDNLSLHCVKSDQKFGEWILLKPTLLTVKIKEAYY